MLCYGLYGIRPSTRLRKAHGGEPRSVSGAGMAAQDRPQTPAKARFEDSLGSVDLDGRARYPRLAHVLRSAIKWLPPLDDQENRRSLAREETLGILGDQEVGGRAHGEAPDGQSS